MKKVLRIAVGAATICLLDASLLAATAPQPPRWRFAPVESDWLNPRTHEILPPAEHRTLDTQGVIEPTGGRDSETTNSDTAQSPPCGLCNGVNVTGDALLNWDSPRDLGGMARLVTTTSFEIAGNRDVPSAAATPEPFSQWFRNLTEQWPALSSIAAMPWKVIGGCALFLIMLLCWLRSRSACRDSSPARNRAVARSQTARTTASQPVRVGGNGGSTGQPAIPDWILETLQSNESGASAESASRDKSEERRQLESWRKLSQVASKAFILEEECEAARQHAVSLSLIAVALGVGGLGIVATKCLDSYSLITGACMSATSLVILGWSGLKVVLHRLRRWILLRPVRP